MSVTCNLRFQNENIHCQCGNYMMLMNQDIYCRWSGYSNINITIISNSKLYWLTRGSVTFSYTKLVLGFGREFHLEIHTLIVLSQMNHQCW